jgi:hypothetical protein
MKNLELRFIPSMTLLYHDNQGNLYQLDREELLSPRFRGRYSSEFVVIEEKISRGRLKKEFTLVALAGALDQYKIASFFAKEYHDIEDFIVCDFNLPRVNSERYSFLSVQGGGNIKLTETSLRIYKRSQPFGYYDPEIVRQIVEVYIQQNFPSISEIRIE